MLITEPPPDFAMRPTNACRKKYGPLNCSADELVELFLGRVEQLGHQAPARAVHRDVDLAERVDGATGQRLDVGLAA